MKRRDFLKYSVVGGTGALVMSAVSPFTTFLMASNKPIKIGLSTPFSGVLTDYGVRLEKGAKLAVETINEQGGILGRKVELIVEDDKTDPATASLKAKKLVFNDKVDFLMGTIASSTTLAVINAIKGTKVPFFWVVEGEDKNCIAGQQDKTRKYVFGIGPTPEQKFEHFTSYMLKNFGKTFYFVGSDYVFPHFVINTGKESLKKHGGITVGEEYAPLGTTEWSSIVTKIEKANPDVLFSVVVGNDGIAFVKQAMNFGLKEKMVITGFPSFSPATYSGIADHAEGIYLPTCYSELIDNPVNKEFVSRYKAKYNPKWPIAEIANEGYSAVHIIKAGAEKAGTTDPDNFVKAVEGLRLAAPQGEIRINPENHLADQHIYLCQIKNRQYNVVKDFGLIAHPGHSGCSA